MIISNHIPIRFRSIVSQITPPEQEQSDTFFIFFEIFLSDHFRHPAAGRYDGYLEFFPWAEWKINIPLSDEKGDWQNKNHTSRN